MICPLLLLLLLLLFIAPPGPKIERERKGGIARRERGSKIAAKSTAVPPNPRATGRPRNNPRKRVRKYNRVISSMLTFSP